MRSAGRCSEAQSSGGEDPSTPVVKLPARGTTVTIASTVAREKQLLKRLRLASCTRRLSRQESATLTHLTEQERRRLSIIYSADRKTIYVPISRLGEFRGKPGVVIHGG
jgi:hypothetical protein